MDGGDWAVVVLLGIAWQLFNVWNDTRVRYRCHARVPDSIRGCRTPVAARGVRCSAHVGRRARSFGP